MGENMLTYQSFRSEFEKEVLDIIIRQTRNFTFKDIFREMKKICDNTVPNDYIIDIVCTSLEFCQSQNYIRSYDNTMYSLNRIYRDKFDAFIDKLNDKNLAEKNTF